MSFLAAVAFVSAMFLPFSEALGETYTVVIEGMKFIPETLTVKVNDTVVWVNKDFFPHTATAEKKGFNSKEIKAGASWRYVAKAKGTFKYICNLHPTMKGSLTVN